MRAWQTQSTPTFAFVRSLAATIDVIALIERRFSTQLSIVCVVIIRVTSYQPKIKLGKGVDLWPNMSEA